MFSRSEKNEDALQCILTKVKTKAEIIVVKRTEVILMLLLYNILCLIINKL